MRPFWLCPLLLEHSKCINVTKWVPQSSTKIPTCTIFVINLVPVPVRFHFFQILHLNHLSRTCLKMFRSKFWKFQILGCRTMVKQHHAKKNAKASWCRTFCNKTTCSLIWYPSLWKWEIAYHFASTKLGQVCILMERIWTQILSVCGIHIHSETLTARKNTAVGTQVYEIRKVTGYAKFGHHRACRVWQFSQHVSFGDPNNRVTMTRVSEPQRNEVNRFQKQWNSWPRLLLPNCFNLVLLPQTWSKLAGFKTTVFTKVSLIEISPM